MGKGRSEDRRVKGLDDGVSRWDPGDGGGGGEKRGGREGTYSQIKFGRREYLLSLPSFLPPQSRGG